MWIEPKTNWTNQDYFNLDPDYARIKGNIEYIQEFSETMNMVFQIDPMLTYTIDEIPLVDFFNTIVENVRKVENGTYVVSSMLPMRDYTQNGVIFDENDLNAIEKNLLIVYNLLMGKWSSLNKLDFMLGVDEL